MGRLRQMLRLKRLSTTLSGSAPSGFLLWSDQGKPSVRCQHSGAKLTNVVRGGWPGLLCVETDVSRIITCKSGGIKVNLLRWEQLWSYSCICFTFTRIPVQPFCRIFSLGVTLLRLHLTIRQSSQAAPMGHQCLHCDLSCKQCSGIQEMNAFEIHLDAQITTHENALFFLYSVLMHHSRV